MGECPRLQSQTHVRHFVQLNEVVHLTYKRDYKVQENHEATDDGKVKEEASICFTWCGVCSLVVQNQDGGGDEICENEAAEEDEHVLRYEAPWRMAGAEENRLVTTAR